MKKDNKINMNNNEKAHYHAGARIVLEMLEDYLKTNPSMEELKAAIDREIRYRINCVNKAKAS